MKNPYIVKVEDLENSENGELELEFNDFIEGIESDEPIKAEIEIKSLGELIKVEGNISGDAILECDLCLEKYKYEFDFDIEEYYAKNTMHEEYGAETELKEGQFIEDLQGTGEINILDLLYQSVILNFPNKKVCGINCKGNTFANEEKYFQEQTDPRMEVFKQIKLDEPKE